MCDRLAVDSKELAGAPETEIEVTPEMVEAGVTILREMEIAFDYTAESVAELVFKAMRKLEKYPSTTRGVSRKET
jgi:hypothetical protein